MSDNPKLRKNGGEGTWVGNALREIVKGARKVSPELLEIAADLTGVGAFDKAASLIREESELTDFEKEYLLGELKRDQVMMQEVTKRWESDNNSDNWASKNVRPYFAFAFAIATITFIALDSAVNGFDVDNEWIKLLVSIDMTIIIAYFGVGRSMFDKNGIKGILKK